MRIIAKSDSHNEFVRQDLISEYGSEHIISITREYKEASKLNGFLAEESDAFHGILLYHNEHSECELVYLHALTSERGIGKLLLQKLIQAIKNQGVQRLWVITTNDNLRALSFYQKQGFGIAKVYQKAMDRVRKIKSFVPEIGKNKIPLRDMIELDMKL